MITAIINLVSTGIVCFTVLAVVHMGINAYLTVKGLATLPKMGLLMWILNLLVQKVENVTGLDIPGYGNEKKSE